MKDRFFIDTNVIVYAFDNSARPKQETAKKLIKSALDTHNGMISNQVVQEFLNVATRKFATPMSHRDARYFTITVLDPLCQVFTNIEINIHALEIAERWGYSFYDSLIVAGAIQSGANILYSEDLQHGQEIYDVTIVNPFSNNAPLPF